MFYGTEHDNNTETWCDRHAAPRSECGCAFAGGVRRLLVQRASQIEIKPVRWVWRDRIALGTLALLAGREGLGKSTLGYWLAARITNGTLPGVYYGTPRAVIVAATEDSWSHTIVPRLIAAGADLDLVLRVDVESSLGFTTGLSLPQDVPAVVQLAHEEGVALMLLDPLISRLEALDTHKDAEVRQALEPLSRAADETGMAILGLIHHNKGFGSDPLNSVMGSKAFTAVARSVHTVVPDPDDESEKLRLFGTVKNNLGPRDAASLPFTIVQHIIPTDDDIEISTGRLEWVDGVGISIREAMIAHDDRAGGSTVTVVKEAAQYLEDYLTQHGGEAPRADIIAALNKEKFTESTIKRAADRLHIVRESSGFPRRSVWRLPDPDPQSAHPVSSRPGESDLTELTSPTGPTESPVSSVSPVRSVSSTLQSERADWGRRMGIHLPTEPPEPTARTTCTDCGEPLSEVDVRGGFTTHASCGIDYERTETR